MCDFVPATYAGRHVQANGLVPIVEPELLIDGDHSIQTFADSSARVIAGCVAALWQQPGLSLDAILLKPQMCIPGADFQGDKPSPETVAEHTLRVMRRCPGFREGVSGMEDRQHWCCLFLNAMMFAQGCASGHPWHHVSVGRAIRGGGDHQPERTQSAGVERKGCAVGSVVFFWQGAAGTLSVNDAAQPCAAEACAACVAVATQ